MKHGVDAGGGSLHVRGISNIALENFSASRVQFRIVTASQHTHPMPCVLELLDDVASKKSTTAGDQSRESLHDGGGR